MWTTNSKTTNIVLKEKVYNQDEFKIFFKNNGNIINHGHYPIILLDKIDINFGLQIIRHKRNIHIQEYILYSVHIYDRRTHRIFENFIREELDVCFGDPNNYASKKFTELINFIYNDLTTEMIQNFVDRCHQINLALMSDPNPMGSNLSNNVSINEKQ